MKYYITFLLIFISLFSFAQNEIIDNIMQKWENSRNVKYIKAIEKEIKKNPHNFKGYIALSTIYLYLEKTDIQIQTLTKGIAFNPNNWHLYYLRGRTYYTIKNYRDALQDFNAALKLNNSQNFTSKILYSLGSTKLKLHDAPGVYDDLFKAFQLDSTHIGILTSLAQAAKKNKKYEDEYGDEVNNLINSNCHNLFY